MYQNELLKIMWLGEEEDILFYAKNERSLGVETDIYRYISRFIDLKQWKQDYGLAYKRWLYENDNAIYNIRNPVNALLIAALTELNKEGVFPVVYYWFDIDRTFIEGFCWEVCPISGERLIESGNEYMDKNGLLSPVYPLMFPKS